MKILAEKILALFSTAEKRSLWRNFAGLSAMQVVTHALPLLILPYVLRVVGAERYGVVASALAVAAFFAVFTDYGINLTATRVVAICREDCASLSRLFSSVMILKLSLLAIGALVLALLLFLIESWSRHAAVFWGAYTVVVGQALFPLWLFQGMERTGSLTAVSSAIRVFFTLGVFILVRSPQDVFWVPALQGLGGIASAVSAWWIARRSLGLRWAVPQKDLVARQIREGWPVFLSNLSINTYIYSNILILGWRADHAAVGFYSVAEKIVTGLRGVGALIFQAVYPRACLRAHEGLSLLRFYRTLLIWSGGAFALIGLMLWSGAPWIAELLGGAAMPRSAAVLRVLAFVPLIVLLNGPAYQWLLIRGKQGAMSAVMLFGAFLNIALNYWLSARWMEIGTAWAVVCTEIWITGCLYVLYFRLRRGSA